MIMLTYYFSCYKQQSIPFFHAKIFSPKLKNCEIHKYTHIGIY